MNYPPLEIPTQTLPDPCRSPEPIREQKSFGLFTSLFGSFKNKKLIIDGEARLPSPSSSPPVSPMDAPPNPFGNSPVQTLKATPIAFSNSMSFPPNEQPLFVKRSKKITSPQTTRKSAVTTPRLNLSALLTPPASPISPRGSPMLYETLDKNHQEKKEKLSPRLSPSSLPKVLKSPKSPKSPRVPAISPPSPTKKPVGWLSFLDRSPRVNQVKIATRERSNSDPMTNKVHLPRHPSVTIQWSDLKMKRMVGKGLLSHVYLAEDIRTPDQHYAVKSMSKSRFPADVLARFAFSERDILRRLSHPNIIKLYSTYQDRQHIHLIMEYGGGGELFTLLRRRKRFPEPWVVIYAAQMLSALAYLHDMGIIFRDLKPENVLLNSQGVLKLADFGFAKGIGGSRTTGGYKGNGRTKTMCGTPEYMAPEIVEGAMYGFAVDWWTLGILIYEMLVGYTPFNTPAHMDPKAPHANDNSEMHKRILHEEIIFPTSVSAEARDLIRGLLERSPSRRSGAEASRHAFFRSYEWSHPPPPPYIPRSTEKPEDNHNFQRYVHDSYLAHKKDGGASEDVWFEDF